MNGELKNDAGAPLSARLEAILFVYGEPVTVKKLAATLKSSENEVQDAVLALSHHYASLEHGITLLRNGDVVGLITKSHLQKDVRSFIKDEFDENLSPASLETLTLVAYLGPVHRNRIEFYRGVNSNFTLRSLLLRGLVERLPDPARNGSFMYRASFELLKHLGLQDVRDLPGYAKFSEELARQPEKSDETEPAEGGSAE